MFLTRSPDTTLADTILLTIEEGVTIYDTDFRLVAWNEKYVEMGITPREHIRRGLHIEDTYRYAAELGVFGEGDPKEIARRRIEDVYAGNSPCVEDLERKDGQIIEIRRYFLNGTGVAAVFSNVTEARRMARKVQRAESMEVLARMTGGIAHDFNNVLQAILGHLALADVEGDEPSLLHATEAAQRGADLANHLMQLARPDRPDDRSSVAVAKSVQSTIRWIEGVIDQKIDLKRDGVADATIWANEGRFSLALVNLILNASDAMSEDGCIHVILELEPSQLNNLRVCVEDTGHGMDEALVSNANEPFFTTKGDKGTGLGLYAVRAFVDSVGGNFNLNSSFGIGTTATMSLPCSTTRTCSDDD